ncbi:hypothetical protein BC833DRAFT_589450 [Globomyces pollinis-pini]|nr:hypothetical protein BC833DRAFT_589450 [Globomyces pollinis-pini]
MTTPNTPKKLVMPKVSTHSPSKFESNKLTDEDLVNEAKTVFKTVEESKKEIVNEQIEEKDKEIEIVENVDNRKITISGMNSILTEQEMFDLKKAKENPKLIAIVKHVDNLIEKTQKARHELESTMQISLDLKDQCRVQEEECLVLEEEHKRISDEMGTLKDRVTQLAAEKAVMESKLEELRIENNELEAFLVHASLGLQEETSTI